MAGEIIRSGDSTSHGGRVLEGSQTEICHGKPIACLGHKVWCPKCKGSYPIVEGVQTTTIFGKGVAVAGMKTACGATLIPSQFTDVITPGSCGGASAARKPAVRMAQTLSAAEGAPVGAGGPGEASAARSIKRIWWSYGKDETPLEDVSRHYVDLNLHVEVENYANGESIRLHVRNEDGTDLVAGLSAMTISLPVGADGTGKLLNVFEGKTVQIGTIG